MIFCMILYIVVKVMLFFEGVTPESAIRSTFEFLWNGFLFMCQVWWTVIKSVFKQVFSSGNIVKRIFAAPFDILGFGEKKKDYDEKAEKKKV